MRIVPALMVVFAGFPAMTAAAIPEREGVEIRVNTPPRGSSYFPLLLESNWVFERSGPAGSDTWVARVGGRSTFNPRYGHVALIGFSGEQQGHHEPAMVRVDREGVLWEQPDTGGSELVWYRLLDPVGSTWTMQLGTAERQLRPCDQGAQITVASRDEVVQVPAGTFPGAVRLDFVPQCADGGTLSEWFAPGVGLIKRVSNSVLGPVVSELVHTGPDRRLPPRGGYRTEFELDHAFYVNNLMPPWNPETLPWVHGRFVIRNPGPEPLELVFSGCASVSLVLVDEHGNIVLTASGDDGGCCICLYLLTVSVGPARPIAIPFSFQLVLDDEQPLPDGRYALRAVLNTLDPEPIRPGAAAVIEIHSVR